MPVTHDRLQPLAPADVQLGAGILQSRFELNRSYLMELKAANLLQNHYFEAGIWGPPGKPDDDIHWGWESPNSTVRGHFVGHWLAAAAQVVAATGDRQLRAKADFVVSELARCQDENGGEWVAPIPEKYLHRIARGRSAWAPMYIVSKTFMGLIEMHKLTGNAQALEVMERAAPWFSRWCAQFSRDEMDDVIDYETCGMLEVWADMYAITGKQEYLELMERFDRSRLFNRLLKGDDLLTNRHANSTIPEVLGAARAYEVTGEQRWRDIVEAYWRFAVTDRGWYVTGGQTSAESWTPPHEQSARLSGSNQEHCTVYNMMRLAEYLQRWTGDAEYADYRERNLVNGILTQQNPLTGMVTYYLPLWAGGKKNWGGRTDSFWCCYGTLVQAHSLHGAGAFYRDADDGALVLSAYTPATVRFGDATVVVSESPFRRSVASGQEILDDVYDGPRARAQDIHIKVTGGGDTALRFRLPFWLAGPAQVLVNGETVDGDAVDGDLATPSSYVTLRRSWGDEDTVRITLPTELVSVPLADRPDTVAFMEGANVLVGLCDHERTLVGDPAHPEGTCLVPDNERDPTNFAVRYRTVGIDHGFRFVPFHQVIDETYTVYFPVKRA